MEKDKKRTTAAEPRPAKITVQVPNMADYVFLDDRYAIHRHFTVTAEFKEEPLVVEVVVEIEDGRARARSVRVSTDKRTGVTAATLRAARVRDVVAWGCRERLRPIKSKSATQFSIDMSNDTYGPAEIALVKELVGDYVRKGSR